jgi:hypothetical protein
MSQTSKSPLAVARAALAVGADVLPAYAHRFSPRRYTQPQLFACLVLKTFLRTDYRGVAQLLADLPDLRAALGLKAVPHFTTLQKASDRLLRQPKADRLLRATVRRFRPRRRRVRRAALDSTGFDCSRASPYFTRRRGRPVLCHRFGKLESVADCASHLFLAARAGRGPRPDAGRFAPLLDLALRVLRIEAALADAGFDAEASHEHAREARGVRSYIPASSGRPSPLPPAGRWRRLMRRRLDKRFGGYGQRWQIETAYSMVKRRLGGAVAARTYWGQVRELLLLALTHNILILPLLEVFYRAARPHFRGRSAHRQEG